MRLALQSALPFVLFVNGCSLLDWDSIQHSSDAGADAANKNDATSDAGTCRNGGTWGAPTYLGVETPNGNEIDGRLSADELTLYYASDDGSGTNYDLRVSKRASRGAPFAPGVPITELDTSSNEGSPLPTADGLALYFSSARSGREKIYVSTRASVASSFDPPTLVGSLNNTASDVGSPWLIPSEAVVLFADDYDNLLFSASRQGSSFAVPVQLQGLTGLLGTPVSADGITLFYSVRANQQQDAIWTATRSSLAAPFTDAKVVSELPRGWPSWISADGCRMIVTSNGTKSLDLVMVERPR